MDHLIMSTHDETQALKKKLRADLLSGRPKSVFSFFATWKGLAQLAAMLLFCLGMLCLGVGAAFFILPLALAGGVVALGAAITYFLAREREGDPGVQ